jgi:hypothetical protein
MSSPRDRGRDFRPERLTGHRDGLRPAHLGESALIASTVAGASHTWDRAAYEALIDAVFTAAGAAEWLAGLRRAVAAMLADKESPPRARAAGEAAGTTGLRIWRP